MARRRTFTGLVTRRTGSIVWMVVDLILGGWLNLSDLGGCVDEEGRWLIQIALWPWSPIRVLRAAIILAPSSGTLVPAIARLCAADEDTVRDVIDVIHAFNEQGLAALGPRWAGGASPPDRRRGCRVNRRDGHNPTRNARAPVNWRSR